MLAEFHPTSCTSPRRSCWAQRAEQPHGARRADRRGLPDRRGRVRRQLRPGFTKRAAWRWTKRLHRLADRTLAPSTRRSRARNAGVPRVHRWARGVDPTRSTPAATRALPATHNGELLVGYVGRLAPEKQVERLRELDDRRACGCVVVGDGPDREQLEKDMPNAEFLGCSPATNWATAYASLDVFIHTGPFETFGQAVQEALATGCRWWRRTRVAPGPGPPRADGIPGSRRRSSRSGRPVPRRRCCAIVRPRPAQGGAQPHLAGGLRRTAGPLRAAVERTGSQRAA